MPHTTPKQRPCPRLHARAITVLAKSLERAFYVVGKREHTSAHEDLTQDPGTSNFVKQVSEKDEQYLLWQIRNYISPRLPIKYRQQLFDEILNDMSTPELDINKLMTALEFEFKAHDAVVSTKHMKLVMQSYLKCLLFGYVSKLDLSTQYLTESCWVAKARRILGTWNDVHKNDQKFPKEAYASRTDIYSIESLWEDMINDHRQKISEAVITTAPELKNLTEINIDYMASDQLVWAIGRHCPLLEDFSLFMETTDRRRYSMHFEDNLVMSLSSLYGHKELTPTLYQGKPCGCPKLQRIVLPIVELREKLHWVESKLLYNLPDLKEVINGATTLALETLFTSPELRYTGKRPLSLTHIEDVASVETMADLLSFHNVQTQSLLPYVTSVKVAQEKLRGGLHYLNSFPKLKYLDVLTDVEFEFAFNTPHLTHMKSTCKWDVKKLASFSQRSPKLEVFVLMTGFLMRHKSVKSFMSFPALRVIKLHHVHRVDPDALIILIKSTTCLTHLVVEDSPASCELNRSVIRTLNDRVVMAALPSLKKLQVFHVGVKIFARFKASKYKFPLTIKSAKVILNNCPDIKYIGNLHHWNTTHKEIEKCKEQLRQNNWDVCLDSVEISTT